MGEEQFRPGCDRRDDSAECVILNKAPTFSTRSLPSPTSWTG
jgi:hypothetical protein